MPDGSSENDTALGVRRRVDSDINDWGRLIEVPASAYMCLMVSPCFRARSSSSARFVLVFIDNLLALAIIGSRPSGIRYEALLAADDSHTACEAL